jgi:hypothetical protein
MKKLYLHCPVLFLLRSTNNHCKNILLKIISNLEKRSKKTSSKMFFCTFFVLFFSRIQTYTDAKNEEHFILFLQNVTRLLDQNFCVNSGPGPYVCNDFRSANLQANALY